MQSYKPCKKRSFEDFGLSASSKRLGIVTPSKSHIMLPLYHESHYTFRFADDRIIPRFHLEGATDGQGVLVHKIDAVTLQRLGQLTTGTVGQGGWVDLAEPIRVQAGDAFIAVLVREIAS